MSYYDNQQWSASGQPSWEQQAPSRSGASSAVPREDPNAFLQQFEEVERSIDNLAKSRSNGFTAPGRRDSVPLAGAARSSFSEQYVPGMTGGPPRHHSVGDFNDSRSFSGSAQNFYATQRQQQPSRGANEAEQVMQAKRRMAAQRERELRNYHQEQQYNRTETPATFGGKAERTMSPAGSGMGDDERRELIARQRSALYGDGSAYSENGAPGLGLQVTGVRGQSPLAFNAQFNQGESSSQQGPQEPQSATAGSGQQRSRANSNSSPATQQNGSFSLSATQQSSRTSVSSPSGSPPGKGLPPVSSGVAPIGTRPVQAVNPALNKRSTTPLPSPLSYGFGANDEGSEKRDARTTSASSNPNAQAQQESALGWGSKSGVWGKNLGVQASVWG